MLLVELAIEGGQIAKSALERNGGHSGVVDRRARLDNPGIGAFQPHRLNALMAANLIVLTPPVLVTILLQRWFVRGLISTEK